VASLFPVRAIVVPYRANGKSRLPEDVRRTVALAMLADVLAACTATASTRVVTDDADAVALARELGASTAADPGEGQAAAVAAALGEGPAVVVNADLPCVVPEDLRALAEIAEAGALGIVEAADGTTNAIALPDSSLFAPLYGPGSAERFREHARSRGVHTVSASIPNLADDVDTLADLRRLALRVGPRTLDALGAL
jgi:2-phospho-L-lactate/phosphoenolpyruvate guanylyltransferase